MATRRRIPITAITVFGTSTLLALSLVIVIYLGFGQAAQTTRELWAEQSKTLIDSLERSLEARLHPIRDQARWVASDIHDVEDMAAHDDYFFGVLAATPQVAGIAVIRADGITRRWHRDPRVAIEEDWNDEPWMADYQRQAEAATGPGWRDPIFTPTVETTTLLHDVPLYDNDGQFIGIFAQIVPVVELSAYLAHSHADPAITPFVIYNHDFVLAHPRIKIGDEQQPLPRLEQIGDPVLERIWTPDEDASFIAPALTDIEASGMVAGDDYYLYLYRNIESFGPVTWTVGAYLNTSLLTDDHTQRLFRALAACLAVLVLAVVGSVIVGRKVSSPVQAIVRAAEAVKAGELERVEMLGGSRIRELDDAGNAFNHMVDGLRERALIRATLGRFVPEKVASSLLAGGGKLDVQQSDATILFCDIEGFTRLTESLGPVKIVDVLNAFFSRMVEILEQHGGVVTQFQGDAILATFNVPIADSAHAQNAVRAAQAMLNSVAGSEFAGERLRIRIGVNSGSVVAGAIGAHGRLSYTVHGDAVNLAARLESMNKEYHTRLLISESSAGQLDDDMELTLVTRTSARGQTRAIEIFTLAALSQIESENEKGDGES